MTAIANALRPWKALLIIVCVLAVLLVLAWVVIRLVSAQMLFYPNADPEAHEALLANPEVEHLRIEGEDGALSGYLLRGAEGPAPLVLYFGGNGENAARTVRKLTQDEARRAAFSGCHFAQIDYPGYGLSEGKPSAATLRRAALAAYDALSARDDVTEILVLGYSIGTGPANYCAASRPASALILMAPYADGVDLFNNVVNVFHGPLRLLVSYDMESVKYASDVTVEPLIFATEADALVPWASSKRLSEAYPASCRFITVPGITHEDFWRTPMVLDEISRCVMAATQEE